MTAAITGERVVLVLTDQVLEATDLADYVSSKNLGRVVTERVAESALMTAQRLQDDITLAFVGYARSSVVDQLINYLAERRALVIVLNGKRGRATLPSRVAHIARPFTDADLDKAVAQLDLCR